MQKSAGMPRTRPAYPPEFRVQITALARAGRRVEDLARGFEPRSHTILSWLRAADRTVTKGGAVALMTNERKELRRLRRENRQLPNLVTKRSY